MERKHKNIITLAAIVVATVLITIGGFIILNSSNPHSNLGGNEQKESNESPLFIEDTTNEAISKGYVSTLRELNRTSNPKFKVGEKYFYHRWSKRPDRLDRKDVIFLPEEYDTVVEVEKIERINKTNYYVLKSSNASVYPEILVYKDGVWKKEVPKIITTTTITTIHETYKNNTKENDTKEKSVSITSGVRIYEGGVVGINEENGKKHIIDVHSMCPVLYRMFTERMLYLNKGVSWIEKYNVSHSRMGVAMSEEEWKVADIENVNGRKCFKVVSTSKTKIIGKEGEKMSGEVITYWVDVEKRILVKMEKREDGVLTETIELTNYEKP